MPPYSAVRDSYTPRPDKRPQVRTPEEAAILCKSLLKRRREHLVVLLMDGSNHLIRIETVAVGSLNVARATPRDVLAPALRLDAAAIILVHNHPSGHADPSEDDLRFTRTIHRAAVQMGVPLWDHIVVARDGHVSLRARGVIRDENQGSAGSP